MAMQIVTGPATKQNSPEWLAWREGGIGASEAPIITGTSKFRTAYELFRIRRGIGPPPPPNPFVDRIRERGHRLEPVARVAYERHTGSTVTPLIAVSAAFPFIRASLDGYNGFDAIPVEIKCPGDTAHSLALKGVVPPEYVDQLQQQMFVTEATYAHYYSFDGVKGVLLKVPRDQNRINQILVAVQDFWNRLQTGKWGTDEWTAAAAAWLSANHNMLLAQEREEAARALLVSLMPKGLKRHEGNGVSVSLSSRKGNIDWRKLFADHGITMTEDQLNQYRRATSDSVTIRDLQGTPLSSNASPHIRSVNSSMSNQMVTVPALPKPSAHDVPVVRDTGREFIF
ncbi:MULTISPECIES: lambda-exonuclease family protein [unclassified Pseudomonas]|uniref:lambda-exonuclease family protein n=1 Tax=unclassified Pseudomonas TaxID=196821 RepID=UPI000C8694DF|nr:MULTISPECIES: YqaJ viral recombinase family protein [unclassified Pseudomonas]PMV96410.1 endonuclease [Pseudomonas sp. GW460-C8]PMW23318.1 endonuclease [Pseudomonas sp. GW456-E6]PMW24206.1 endonuclease [Pseudomonas sp. GW456-11-11-14-TSB2]PMW40100.1 endonuclease [Pseudomonas sp. GW460-7]PMW41211.1 endonuclease [Pseudomonas sp. FW305-3-2-15-A-R2A1]